MRLFAFFFILALASFFINPIYAQQVDSFLLESAALKGSRLVKIWTPNGFNKNQKYTVVYTLDAKEFFDLVTSNVQFLSNANVQAIPNTIVVGVAVEHDKQDLGILKKENALSEQGLLFQNMLVKELVPRIKKDYPTSGFNTIVGHANASTFLNFLLTNPQTPFKGYIALSPSQMDKTEKRIIDFLKQKQTATIYYYLAEAAKDESTRLKMGQFFKQLFENQANPNVKFEYAEQPNATLATLPVFAIPAALTHIYSDFKHLDASDTTLLATLAKAKTNPLAYLKQHKAELVQQYGIEPKTMLSDLSFLIALAERTKDVKAIEELWSYSQANFKDEKGLLFAFGRLYEATNFLDKAESLYLKNLEDEGEKGYLAYYHPFYLYYAFQNDPIKAIKMAKKANKEYADDAEDFSFYYHLAQVSAKFNTKSRAGTKAIEKYIEQYNENARFSLVEAYYEQARILADGRQEWKAKEILKKVLTLDPNFEPAKQLLEELNE